MFLYIAALHPAQKHVEREFFYPHYTLVLNLVSIEFLTLSQIKKSETLNNISNVYINEKGIVPIWFTDRKRSKHVNLLYVEDDNAGYFALIKNLSINQFTTYQKKEQKIFLQWYVIIIVMIIIIIIIIIGVGKSSWRFSC